MESKGVSALKKKTAKLARYMIRYNEGDPKQVQHSLKVHDFAALIAKGASGDPQTLPASDAMEIATRNGAEAFGIDAGLIAEGKLADAILIRLDDVCMHPLHHLVSNWVYAANSSIVDTVICDGRILMKNREFVKA